MSEARLVLIKAGSRLSSPRTDNPPITFLSAEALQTVWRAIPTKRRRRSGGRPSIQGNTASCGREVLKGIGKANIANFSPREGTLRAGPASSPSTLQSRSSLMMAGMHTQNAITQAIRRTLEFVRTKRYAATIVALTWATCSSMAPGRDNESTASVSCMRLIYPFLIPSLMKSRWEYFPNIKNHLSKGLKTSDVDNGTTPLRMMTS